MKLVKWFRLLLRRWLRPPREVDLGRWLRAQRQPPPPEIDPRSADERIARNAAALEERRRRMKLARAQVQQIRRVK